MADEATSAEVGAGRRLFSLLDRICWALALLGGLVLLVLASITVVSVTGRYLFSAPIRGDIEVVGLLTGIAVSLFLPYCQLRKGNVIVDVFTDGAPPRVRAALDAIGSLAIAAAGAVLAWRLTLGGMDLARFGDESMVLRIPTWWGFVVVVPCFVLLAIAGVVTFVRELQAATMGRRP
jgi:TRAP-type C4-dicarboxylate transport system permease small subunit